MVKSKSNLWVALAAPLLLGIASCSKDDDGMPTDPQTQAKLSAVAVESGSSSSSSARVEVSGFAVSQFSVGTQDVDMKYYAEADLTAGISLGDLQLKSAVNAGLQSSSSSKKSVVLISNGESKFGVIGEGGTPEGNYTEVAFKLYKSTESNANDPMYQKSLLITGEINGKLAQVWTESEKSIRASSKSSTGVDVSENTEMVLQFELDKLFAGVNMGTALDANGDGRIEIGPNSPDGNAAILAKIESNLETAVSLNKR
ncbi:hypothetical protein [Algoriphagus oliviformis]|uniref:hypothetical protein n=1 Tax=Algoriphagus oliviformis TaxID=2811231 RepID=UPI001F3A4001|nr:hypothetical protein [Algoriphagus oliviformis]